VVSGRFFLFVTPITFASLLFRGLIWGLHRLGNGKHFLIEGLLLFFVCMPLAFFAEAVVAAMYLRALRGDRIGLAEFLEVAGYPGAASVIARLVGMCALWLVPSLVVGGILSALLKWFVHLVRPDIHLALQAKHGGQWWVIVALSVYVAVVSRYDFVMPMLAVRRSGGGEAFRAAVQRIKGYWGLLALVGVVECLAMHFASEMAKRAGVWRGGRQAAVLAEILFSAVIATYVATFRTDLLVKVEAAGKFSAGA
jgi:hypothetical protein